MKTPLILAALCGALMLQSPAADRVALVIGNNAYQHGTPLKNCVNDAKAVAAGLQACGFEVSLVTDTSLANLEAKLREFKQAATRAQAAWFYYAGHGAEVAGSNYLIPVDAQVEDEHEVKRKTMPLDEVLGAMDGSGTPLKVVVLDSCRDNPFGRGWSRSGAKGLAQIAKTPKGTIIAYATAPGEVAADGNGANSPYTTALLRALAKPGLEIEQVFKETGRAVMTATGEKQNPWLNMSFYGNFVIRRGNGGGVPAPQPGPAPSVQAELAGSPLDRGVVGDKYEATLPGGAKIVFRYCPPGNFTMGSPETEEDRHFDEKQVPVRISKGFWLAQTECTQGQWKAVTGANPSFFKGGDQLPVEQVSWEDIQGFLAKRNAVGGLPAGWKWALPTEAQWEYACRAGTTTVFFFGDSLTSLQANFEDSKLSKTVAVGSYAANAWGLHDMHGNVWEWCADWYGEELAGGADPLGAGRGIKRMIRGGTYSMSDFYCRAALRSSLEPGIRGSIVGFRPALVPSR